MLPSKLPYTRENIKKKITSFLGINLTETQKEGEFTDTLGLSSEKYPVLTQRKGREKQTTYSDVVDMFEWDGKTVVIASGLLYFDGTYIANVTNDKKQFAVVNSHLIVMPDGIDIDMTSEYYDDGDIRHFTYKFLKTSTSTTGTSSFATGKNITAALNPILDTITTWSLNYRGFGLNYEEIGYWNGPCIYTYGTNLSAVRNCYSNGAWNMSSLAAIEHLTSPFVCTPNSIDFQQGQIVIFKSSGSAFTVNVANNYNNNITLPAKTYNSAGYFGVFSGVNQYSFSASGGGILDNVQFDVYKADVGTRLFSLTLHVGDFVSCNTGDSYAFNHAKITAINDTTNTLSVALFNSTTGEWDANAFPTTTKTYSNAITITKDFPDLDYICEKGNRLYGVSNRDKTIYVSALGIPSDFYTLGNDDTDAYAVAVGSEGEFTAICSYGDAVLCWKENTVHKVLGDYPSNFYTNEYKIAGVQKGSEKSLCVINETLLYKGVNGVFTYTGSTPSLISSSLGRTVYHKAVGGTDGNRYYISMTDDHHNPFLFTYDLVNGIWLKEDNLKADAFTKISGVQVQILGGYYYEDQFFMVSGGFIYKLSLDNNEKFEWVAEFAPFYTYATASSSYTRSFGKQTLSKLTFQMEMEKGSRIILLIKEDNNPYRVVQIKSAAEGNLTTVMPIRVGRCDKIQVKIKGYGRVTIRGLERSYFAGSEA